MATTFCRAWGGDPPMRTHPDAACRRVQDPDMFYPERCDEKSARPAVKVCSRCPLRWEVCLPWALEHEREWGIWAELTPAVGSGHSRDT